MYSRRATTSELQGDHGERGLMFAIRFADELGLVDEAHPGPNLFDLAAGVANALATGPFTAGLGGGAEGHPVMWTGSVRSSRRRVAGQSNP